MRLDLADLRAANTARCNDVFHPVDSWSPNDWATALAGEVGLDLLAARLRIDLAAATIVTFNQVSARRRSTTGLSPGAPDRRVAT